VIRPTPIRRLLASATAVAALALAAGCGGGDERTDAAARSQSTSTRDTGAPAAPRNERSRAALAEAGQLVFIGDSLAVAGSDPYPTRIDALLERPIVATNLAQAGTTSEDWLPGTAAFEQGLRPLLADADAVFVSVGGTDLERAVVGSSGPDALEQAGDAEGALAIEAAFDRIERNLGRTFAAIEEANPRAAIVFVGYPDYSASAVWRERSGTLGAIALRAGLGAFGSIARRAGADLTIDMLDVTRPRIDSLLSDGEHLSDAGHRLYAEEIGARLDP
jgi:lysophospholipase L1-like esterase